MNNGQKKTDSELAELYDCVYKTPNANGNLYGFICRRAPFFVEFIRNNLVTNSSVIDLGCGRGQLIRWLRVLGYVVEGTEIAQCLFEDDLKGLPVQYLFYSQLNIINSNSFDCVVSNDVLEHLAAVEDIELALSNMVRISKKYVLLSIGGLRAAGSVRGNLHEVIRPQEWWTSLFSNYCNILEEKILVGSLFLFGRIK
jgi:SAM-dependent methyltransferase